MAEVVSAGSEDRDRRYEPFLYAGAGIRHLRRIEDEDGRPAVHTYELDDTTRAYVATGVQRDRPKPAVPFGHDIDLPGLVG